MLNRFLQSTFFIAGIAVFIAWIVMSDEQIGRQMPRLVDAYQITIGLTLIFLAPLLAVRPLRGLTGPCFAILATALLLICLCISLITVYALWGTTGVTIGMLLAGVGEIPLAILAAILKGKWVMLVHVILPLVGFIACTLASDHAEKNREPQTDKPGQAPGTVTQASNIAWICLILGFPACIQMATSSTEGLAIGIFSALILAAAAIGIRKGLKVAFVLFIGANIFYIFKHDHDLFPVDLSGLLNGKPDAYIDLFRTMQNALSFFTAALMLTPSALRWFWKKPGPPPLPA